MVFHANAFLEPKTPHKDMLQTIAAEYRPGDRIWYNFSYGGLGSSITQEVGYHLKFDAPTLNSDEFIWDAPNDYADVEAVPRVWDVRPYWIPIPNKALAPLTSDRVQSEEYDFGAYAVRLYEAPPLERDSGAGWRFVHHAAGWAAEKPVSCRRYGDRQNVVAGADSCRHSIIPMCLNSIQPADIVAQAGCRLGRRTRFRPVNGFRVSPIA